MHDPAQIHELKAAILAHMSAHPGVQATTFEVAEEWLVAAGTKRAGQDLVWIALTRLEARQLVRRETAAGRIVWCAAGEPRAIAGFIGFRQVA